MPTQGGMIYFKAVLPKEDSWSLSSPFFIHLSFISFLQFPSVLLPISDYSPFLLCLHSFSRCRLTWSSVTKTLQSLFPRNPSRALERLCWDWPWLRLHVCEEAWRMWLWWSGLVFDLEVESRDGESEGLSNRRDGSWEHCKYSPTKKERKACLARKNRGVALQMWCVYLPRWSDKKTLSWYKWTFKKMLYNYV